MIIIKVCIKNTIGSDDQFFFKTDACQGSPIYEWGERDLLTYIYDHSKKLQQYYSLNRVLRDSYILYRDTDDFDDLHF